MPLNLTNRSTLFASLPHGGRVVEVGVELGRNARVILAQNQPAELTLVDPWRHLPGSDWERLDEGATLNLDDNYQIVRSLFYGDPRVTLMRKLSTEAAALFPDESLDIVYIDADHYQAAQDIAAWWPKVKPGGYLCGHDYTMNEWIKVQRDVDAFALRVDLPLYVTQEQWPSWCVKKPASCPTERVSDIALLVTVYPPYADLLPGCLAAIEHYWPGHPPLHIGPSTLLEVAPRLLESLCNIETEFVVTLHEDYHLSAPVKQDLFDECLAEMRSNANLISCSLTWEPSNTSPYHFPKLPYNAHFQTVPPEWDYAINFQMRIWHRTLLMQLLAQVPDGTTNADLEPVLTRIFRAQLPATRAITYAFPDPPNPGLFVDAVDQSAWIVAYHNLIYTGAPIRKRAHRPTSTNETG
jgi:hypothetical protein